jgi:hypothetical protein
MNKEIFKEQMLKRKLAIEQDIHKYIEHIKVLNGHLNETIHWIELLEKPEDSKKENEEE